MRSKGVRATLVLVALLIVLSPAAHAQASNVCVAAQPPMDAVYTAFGYEAFPTVQEAVDAATARAAAVYQHYSVFVDWQLGAPWVESVSIYADADITIRGVSSPLPGTSEPPQSIVIQSSSASLPAMETIAPQDSAAAVNNLVVDGLTLTGGSAGFLAKSGAAPTLNRVYVINNAGAGVSCQDGSDVLLVNCSIVHNAADGVEVLSNSFARIVFCTIYSNNQSGVYVDSANGADAAVENSIVYQNTVSGLEWGTASSPTLNSNDVYDNNGVDYVNVTAGPGSLSVDPKLWPETGTDPTPWVGALLTSQCIYGIYTSYTVYSDVHSPVIDMADPGIEILPFTAEDFYGDPRPVAFLDPAVPLPDMGADEVACGLLELPVPVWYECVILPDPIGKLDARELVVEIRLGYVTPTTPVLYMVPEGADETPNLTPPVGTRIEFTLTASDGSGWYRYENTTAIDPADFAALGNLIDGHAIVYLTLPDTLYTYGYTASDLIRGQAIPGRHVIIDTTPPQFAVPAGGFDAADLVTVLNAQAELTAAGGLATGLTLGTHPAGVGAFPAGWLPATDPAPVWSPAGFPNTDTDGLITPYTYTGQGTQLFTNVGSLSNNIGADNLNIEVLLPFEDLPPPVDPLNPAGPRVDRTVAGFEPSGTQTMTGTPSTTFADWQFSVGASLFTNALTVAQCVYTTSGPNMGFDPIDPGPPGDRSYDYANNRTEGKWTFAYNGFAGLDPAGPLSSPHVSVRFVAIDRAGNRTEVSETLEPLHIWWLNDIHSRIVPNVEGDDQVAEARFNVQLTRAQNPVAPYAELPNWPVFTYRFYRSDNYDGPYVADGGWAAWTSWAPPARTIFRAGNFGGQWVLLVTLVADEAGNVEQWPTEIGLPDAPLDLSGVSSGVNWMRFKIGPGSLDTALTPNFWHDLFGTGQGIINSPPEAVFGAQSIIPSPADTSTTLVSALFRIETRAAVSNRAAQWFLYPAGSTTATDSGIVDPGAGIDTALIPNGYRLEDINSTPQARRPMNWVFTAATFTYVDSNGNSQYDTGETIESVDQTPASFAFTVVPETSLDAYVRNRESMDRQPIKVQEER